jgi:hypothetical protein
MTSLLRPAMPPRLVQRKSVRQVFPMPAGTGRRESHRGRIGSRDGDSVTAAKTSLELVVWPINIDRNEG